MPNRKKLWTDYPPQYARLAKDLAMASLPKTYGPKPLDEALAFRRSVYRFRDSLRESISLHDGSYPSRLYIGIQSLSIKVKPNVDNPPLYDIIFYQDPVVSEVNERIDPETGMMDELMKENFIAAQRFSETNLPTDDIDAADDIDEEKT